jgi:membrane protein DedA with SNARE-associated domain
MSPAGRRRFMLVVAAWAMISAAGLVAKAFLPLLVRDHPLLLVVLDGRTRNLLLASPKIGVADFIVVGVVWRFTVHSLYYLIGRWYGDSALRWVARKSRLRSRIVDRAEQVFGRVAAPAVLVLSNKWVCVLAGAAGMSPRWFVALHLPGTVLRIVALHLFAGSAYGPISRIVVLIDRNALWLTVAFVVATMALIVWRARLHYRRFQASTVVSTEDASQSDASTTGGPRSGTRDGKTAS